MQAHYPDRWEADVVLADGGTAHLRPITPEDADRMRAFHSRLSDESIYFRFFGPHPRLSDREVERFTVVDHVDRVALIATIGEEMTAVVRYDRIGPGEAEVAFLVEDAHQGRGLASVLLEHIGAAARERGLSRFVAEVLPGNRRMIGVFRQAGYTAESTFEDGVVRLTLDLTPTPTSREVMRAREHRAESRSIQRLLTPSSVAVVGASREPDSVGQTVLRHLLAADFTGPVYPVHREARSVAGVRAHRSVEEIDGEVDLAVLAVPAEHVLEVVEQCARKGVHGLVVVSSGFGETGEEGMARQRELVRIARSNGMRVVGPNCLGIANTAADVRLNATLAGRLPPPGRVGFFSQSGALGTALLQWVAERGMGISTFVSAGNRVDVSGNDLLQYWEEDPATEVILLYLESLGNPRKFARLARRISRRKPIVAVKSGGATRGVPEGHAAPALRLPDVVLSSLFEQSGVIRVDDLTQLFDVAQLLAHQPLPQGSRIGVVGNSDALALLAVDACVDAGLDPRDPVDLGARAGAAEFGEALTALLDDPGVDAVVVVYVPPLSQGAEAVAAELARVAGDGRKPVVATYLGRRGMPPELRRTGRDGAPGRGAIPSYPSPEEAVRALAHVARHAAWRRRPSGTVPDTPGIDPEGARALVDAVLHDPADGGDRSDGHTARPVDASALLARYGVTVWPAEPVDSADAAVAAAERLGWPVALKAIAPEAQRAVGGVRLGLGGEESLREAYAALSGQLAGASGLAVQRMTPLPAVHTVVGAVEDPAFGAVVSFGLGDVTAALLGDRAYRLAPLTEVDAADLVRSIRAAPLLFGRHGAAPVRVSALEELLIRVGRLTDEIPELSVLELDPVMAGDWGVAVLGATAVVREPTTPLLDRGPRRLG
ncbi:bifunctional GNAT family N-acetyltransferase/acetate--CoA ligase family protein [Rhizohabitans arisaemae]|uniref:bifunctional acetate--CoA ligase family protein/GNAT family N-acetyltransferase n=1 Tax=Rhizohabitans arisaemae TaxID=2720610 RepID=UPI0024B0F2A0|nr:bifunctional GNAT family N-acetyltransferase/acetate--CoA ligase family protein [Rhizohabitans arisaemae]